MDGYALRFTDLNGSSLKVVGTAWAGKAFAGSVGPGECARIMTGGVMPEGTDTVVLQEHGEQQQEECLSARLDRSHRHAHQKENERKASQPRRSLRAVGGILSAIHCHRYRVCSFSRRLVSYREKVPELRVAPVGDSGRVTTPRRRRRDWRER